MDPRTVKPRTPARLIVAAAFIGLFLIGFMVFAIWYSSEQIADAKMTGEIVSKEFVPEKEHQIILQRQGSVETREKEGDYILTVEVPQADGTKKPYNVWVDKARYDALKVGDSFDVGPYLVPE